MKDGFTQPDDALARLKSNAVWFASSLGIVAAAIVCVGWFTALQQVAYGAMISSVVFMLLPFAVILAGLALCLIEIGEPFVVLGAAAIKPYYRWLARQNHPAFWGAWMGVGIGGVILYGINGIVILPGEARTVEIIADAQAAIEDAYKRNGRYPLPNAENHLELDDLNGAVLPVAGGVVVDGFKRPIVFELEGRWKLARYRISSVGYDGVSGGGDDFCLSGSSKLAKVASVASRIVVNSRSKPSGRIARFSARLDAIQALRCADQ